MAKEKETIQAVITSEERARLEVICEREHRSISSMVRILILQFLDVEYDLEDVSEYE